MAPFFRLVIFFAIACGKSYAAEDILPWEDLTQFKNSLEEYYPPTVCALKKLAKNHYEVMLESDAEGGLSGWERNGKKRLPTLTPFFLSFGTGKTRVATFFGSTAGERSLQTSTSVFFIPFLFLKSPQLLRRMSGLLY